MARLPFHVDAPHHTLREVYERVLKNPSKEDIAELNELATHPDLLWTHYVQGIDPKTRKILPSFEDKPGALNPLSHWGTKQAALDRFDWINPAEQLDPPIVDAPQRTLLANIKAESPMWVDDNGLLTPSDHLVGGINHPLNDQDRIRHMLNDEGIEVRVQNRGGKDHIYAPDIPDTAQGAQDVDDILSEHGYDTIMYANKQEDKGNITMSPIGFNRIYNARTGERIRDMATPVAGGGLLATGSDAEAADFSTDHLHQLDEYMPEPKVGAVTQFIADMATDFAGWREQVNKDLRENPVAALASLPIGAIEEVWAGTNLALEGWTALDKFIDQNDDVRRVDQILDKSYEYKDKFGDFFTEQGFPESWRTVGGITGVGGVATKGAKKGAEVLYDLYRLGL